MTIRTYKVTLDSKNTIAPEPVFLRQGDKTGAVVIDATLMDNGSPVSLSGLTPMFKANTADGQAVIIDSTGFNIVNASGGEFTYQVPNALSAVPGKIVTAYFSLSDASGSESTFDVAFIIKKAVDITKPQADEYITIIDGTIQSLQQKIDSMNSDIQTILNAYNQGDFYNKAETDSKDAATLTSAKSYADSGDSATLTSAKSYTDNSLSGIAALQKFIDYDEIKGQSGWSGSNTMGANQTVTSTIPLSQCPNGWFLVFYMSSGKTDRNISFIPKSLPDVIGTATVACIMHTATGGHVTQKTLAVTDTTLTGNDNNVLTTDVSGHPNDFVLAKIVAV